VVDNHDQTWSHLLSKIQDAEEKINRSLRELKKELLKDIEEAKKN